MALSETEQAHNQHSVDKIKMALEDNLDAAAVLQVPSAS